MKNSSAPAETVEVTLSLTLVLPKGTPIKGVPKSLRLDGYLARLELTLFELALDADPPGCEEPDSAPAPETP